MFRSMRRFKQAMSEEECAIILQQVKRGVLAVAGEDGYPYATPMNHYYDSADGHLYFHCAKEGHKQDALAACDKVSYCVYTPGYAIGDDWALHVDSVVVFGRIRTVEDPDKKAAICRGLAERFTDDEAFITHQIDKYLGNVRCLELIPEHISGKHVTES